MVMSTTKKRPARQQGWLPHQHGAWAMLIVPVITGAVLRARAGVVPSHVWLLALTWLAAYFAFNSWSLYLRAAPARRANYRTPALVYLGVVALLGVLTLASGGWTLLWWLVPFTVIGLAALALAARRKDRSLTGGALTVAAAVAMTLVTYWDSPAALVTSFTSPATKHLLATTLALFGYFFGTVVHVKALIREHGQQRAGRRSLLWHLLVCGYVVVAAAVGWISWWWPPLALGLLVRTWWLHRLDSRLRLRPLQIGLVEIGASVLVLAAALS